MLLKREAGLACVCRLALTQPLAGLFSPRRLPQGYIIERKVYFIVHSAKLHIIGPLSALIADPVRLSLPRAFINPISHRYICIMVVCAVNPVLNSKELSLSAIFVVDVSISPGDFIFGFCPHLREQMFMRHRIIASNVLFRVIRLLPMRSNLFFRRNFFPAINFFDSLNDSSLTILFSLIWQVILFIGSD